MKKREVLFLVECNGPAPVSFGWVLKIRSDVSLIDLHARLEAAINEYHHTPKGVRCPVETFEAAFKHVPSAIFGRHGVRVCTRTPIDMVRSIDSRLPNPAVHDSRVTEFKGPDGMIRGIEFKFKSGTVRIGSCKVDNPEAAR